jgi:hypothetical protein
MLMHTKLFPSLYHHISSNVDSTADTNEQPTLLDNFAGQFENSRTQTKANIALVLTVHPAVHPLFLRPSLSFEQGKDPIKGDSQVWSCWT